MTNPVSPIRNLIAAAIIFAALFGVLLFAYVAIQQDMRLSANDPQIQMAEDAAAALGSGGVPAAVVPTGKVDISASLAPFLIVTDESYHVLASSGALNGQTLLPPAGAFQDAKNNTGSAGPQQNRITWEPAAGVREAAVIVHYQGGYVIAARSLREVENREDQLTTMAEVTGLGLVVLAVGLFLVIK